MNSPVSNTGERPPCQSQLPFQTDSFDSVKEILGSDKIMGAFFDQVATNQEWLQSQITTPDSTTKKVISRIVQDPTYFKFLPQITRAAFGNPTFRSLVVEQGKYDDNREFLEQLKAIKEGGELLYLDVLLSKPQEPNKISEVVKIIQAADLSQIPLPDLFQLMMHGIENKQYEAVTTMLAKMTNKTDLSENTPNLLLPLAVDYGYRLKDPLAREAFFNLFGQILKAPELIGPHRSNVQLLHDAVLRQDAKMVNALLQAGMDPNLKDQNSKNALNRLQQTLSNPGTLPPANQDELKALIRALLSAGINPHEVEKDLLAFAAYPNPQQIPEKEIFTVKNFALLSGDAFIAERSLASGTKLEGSHVYNTASILLRLLDEVQKDPALKDIKAEDLLAIKNQFTRLYEFDNRYSVSNSTPTTPENINKILIQELTQNLAAGQTYLIPMGYQTPTLGHVVLCEFTKLSNGNFNLKLINEGEGVGYHTALPGEFKQKYSPFLCYENVTLQEMEESKLLTALAEMKVRLPPIDAHTYSSEDIYRNILRSLEGKINPNPPDDLTLFMTSQRSGTCAIRGLFAYMRMKLGTKNYKLLKHSMETTAAQKTLESDRDLIRNDPIAADVMIRTAENIARRGKKLEKIGLIPAGCVDIPKKVKEEVSQLNPKAEGSASLNFQTIPPEFREKGAAVVTGLQTQLYDLFTEATRDPPTRPAEKGKNLSIPHLPHTELDASSLTNHLDAIFAFTRDSLLTYDDPKIARQVMVAKAMELPLPKSVSAKDIWDDIPTTQLPGVLKNVQMMMNFLYSDESPVASYANLTAMQKLYAIAWKLACRQDEEGKQQTSTTPHLKNYRPDLTVLEDLANPVEDISLDPVYLEEVRGILKFFKDSQISTSAQPLFRFQDWKRGEYDPRFSPPAQSADNAYAASLVQNLSTAEVNALMEEYTTTLTDEQKKDIPLQEWMISKMWLEAPKNTLSPFHLIRNLAVICQVSSGILSTGYARVNKAPTEACLNDTPIVLLKDLEIIKPGGMDKYVQTIGLYKDFGQTRSDIVLLQPASTLEKFTKHDAQSLRYFAHPGISSETVYQAFKPESENQLIATKKDAFLERHSMAMDPRLQIDHLIQYYRHHMTKLLNHEERVFFFLCLFNKGALKTNVEDNPNLAKDLVELCNKGLDDFRVLLTSASTDRNTQGTLPTDASSAFLQLLMAKARVLKTLTLQKRDKSFLEKEKAGLNALLEEIRSGKESFKVFEEPVLAHLVNTIDIMAKDLETDWTDPNTACKVLSLQAKIANTPPNIYQRIDYFYPQTCAAVIANRADELQRAFQKPEAVSALIVDTFKTNGFTIDPAKIRWEGDFKAMRFPCYDFKLEDVHFRMNALTGCIWQDGIDIHTWQKIISTYEFKHHFESRTFSNFKASIREDQGGGKQEIFYDVNDGKDDYRFIVINNGKGDLTIKQIEKKTRDKTYVFTKRPTDVCLPLPKPVWEKYLFWIDQQTKTIVVDDKVTGQSVLTLGKTVKVGDDPTEWDWIHFDSKSKANGPAFQQLFNFDAENAVIGLQHGDTVRLNFSNYQSPSGQMLQFETGNIAKPGHPVEKQMVWTENPHYYIAPEQKLNGGLKRFLLLETKKGEHKALIPIQTFSEMKKQKFETEDVNTCALVTVDKAGNLAPSEPREHLLLAHHFLAEGLYDKALEEIKKGRNLVPYSPEEFQLLGRILKQDEESKDYTPEAQAVRLFAAWLARDNIKKFPDHFQKMNTELRKGIFARPLEAHMNSPPNIFTLYFLENEVCLDKVSKNYSYYLAVCQNLPPAFHLESGKDEKEKGFLTAFEEMEWLSELLGPLGPKQSALGDRLLALQQQLTSIPFSVKPRADISDLPISPLHDFYEKQLEIGRLNFEDKSEKIPLKDLLSTIPRVRPGNAISENFGTLLHYAMGTPEEKKQIQALLDDCRFEFNKKTELLKYILEGVCNKNTNLLALLKILKERPNDIVADKIAAKLKQESISYRRSILKTHFQGTDLRELPTPDYAKHMPSLSTSSNPRIPLKLVLENLDANNTRIFETYFSQTMKAETRSYQWSSIPKEKQVDHYAEKKEASLADWKEGCLLNDQVQQTRMKDVEQLGNVSKEVAGQIAILQKQKDSQFAAIQRLINTLPTEAHVRQIAEMQVLGKTYQFPTVSECIALFVQGDMKKYQSRLPYLTPQQIEALHTRIGLYLSTATVQQRFVRAKGHLEKAAKAKINGKQEKMGKSLALAGQELSARRSYDINQRPSFLAFEFAANITLRPAQCENLEKMLKRDDNGEYQDVLLQMIMAAGKTFVLGTLMALEKADGYHLSILIPPGALFDTNVQDMQKRSDAFFGQRANTILFNRVEEQFTVSYLRRMKHTILQAIQNREYVMMPPETLQSMQNKYIEARDHIASLQQKAAIEGVDTSKDIQKLEEACQELKSILKIIKERGVATFDEVDMIYNPRKELNYPTVDTSPVDQGSIQLISELIHLIGTDSEIRNSGLDILNNRQAEMIPDDYHALLPLLTNKFVERIGQTGTLQDFLGIDLKRKGELQQFLTSPDKEIPQWLKELKERLPEAAERVILLKKELQEWLPNAFTRSVDEHYGRSNNSDYGFARPNLAAKTPNERSEFADKWDLLNKTLLVYMHHGLDDLQIAALVAQFREKATAERRSTGDSIKLDQTQTALLFKQVTGVDLFKVDTSLPDSLKKLREVFQSKDPQAKQFVIDYLAFHLFSKWKIHTKQISANAQDLGALVKTVQGYSGTMDDPYIFPDSCKIQMDRGTNGRVVDVLCRQNPVVHQIEQPGLKAEDFLARLFKGKTSDEIKKMHALIDIGAYFKGYPNDAVAKSLLEYFKKDPNSSVQGILYYDPSTNKLAFIKRGTEEKPVLLPGTDAATIRRVTGLKPQQLFTFYDQNHTTGSDIPQAPDATAFATIGANDTLRNILQGSMRMRQLFQGQHIEFVVPATLQPLIATRIGTDRLQVQDILNFAEVNSCLNENEDGLRVCVQKMGNSARAFIIGKLMEAKSPVEENRIFSQVSDLFIRDLDDRLYEKYQMPSVLVDSSKVLNEIAAQYIKIVQRGMEGASDPKGQEAVERQIREIATAGVKHVPKKLEARILDNLTLESTVENQVEAQKQVEAEKEAQKEQEPPSELSHYKPSPAKEKGWKWIPESIPELLKPVELSKTAEDRVGIFSLKEVIEQRFMGISGGKSPMRELFSEDILVTENYARTVEGQLNILDNYQKPIHEALAFKDPATGKYRLIFLSIAEAAEWKQFLKENAGNLSLQIGLIQPEGRLVEKGTLSAEEWAKEMETLDSPVRKLLVQALVMKGHVKELMSSNWKPALESWLNTHRFIKRNLFEQAVMQNEQASYYKGSGIEKLFNQKDPGEDLSMTSILVAGSLTIGQNDRFYENVMGMMTPENLRNPVIVEGCFKAGLMFLSDKRKINKTHPQGQKILETLLPYVQKNKHNQVIQTALRDYLTEPSNAWTQTFSWVAQYMIQMELENRDLERDIFILVADRHAKSMDKLLKRDPDTKELAATMLKTLFILSGHPGNKEQLIQLFLREKNPGYYSRAVLEIALSYQKTDPHLVPLVRPILFQLLKDALDEKLNPKNELLESLKSTIKLYIQPGMPSIVFTEPVSELREAAPWEMRNFMSEDAIRVLYDLWQIVDPEIKQLVSEKIVKPLLIDLEGTQTKDEVLKNEIIVSYASMYKPPETIPSPGAISKG